MQVFFAMVDDDAVIHVSVIATNASDGLAPGIYRCGHEDAGYLCQGCTYAQAFGHEAAACLLPWIHALIVQGIEYLVYVVLIPSKRDIHFIRFQHRLYCRQHPAVIHVLADAFHQHIVADVVEVLAEVNLEDISLIPISAEMPPQMLLEALAGERYALALEACAVIIDEMAGKLRHKHEITEGVLHHHVPDCKSFHQSQVAILHATKCAPFFLLVHTLADGPLQVAGPSEAVHAIILCAILPAAGLLGSSVSFDEVIGISEVILHNNNCGRAGSINIRR